MVNADAVAQQLEHLFAVRAAKALALQGFGDDLFLVLAAKIEAEQALRRFGRAALREVDDVDRRAPLVDQGLRGLLQQLLLVLEVQRHRPIDGAHRHDFGAGAIA